MSSTARYYLFMNVVPGGILAPKLNAVGLHEAKKKAPELIHSIMHPNDGRPGYKVTWAFLMPCDAIDPEVITVMKREAGG